MAEKIRFYLVWNEKAGCTGSKYHTETAARQEAEMLAQYNPGDEFYVLSAVSYCKVRHIEWTELKSELPF